MNSRLQVPFSILIDNKKEIEKRLSSIIIHDSLITPFIATIIIIPSINTSFESTLLNRKVTISIDKEKVNAFHFSFPKKIKTEY
ncbi:hypothetical protein MHK_006553 [Candidatus Magnetomorum sp. HK-1]|nr:hypothetical protein MHK_006553 [Candidatus Magnetomorum sp. HK-1]